MKNCMNRSLQPLLTIKNVVSMIVGKNLQETLWSHEIWGVRFLEAYHLGMVTTHRNSEGYSMVVYSE